MPRSPLRHSGFALFALCLLLAAPARLVAQQDMNPGLALVGGPMHYDLSGTGTSGFGALRFELPMTSAVIFEPGLTYARYTPLGGGRRHLIIPEFQLQLQAGSGVLRPYLGGGAGLVFTKMQGVPHTTSVTLTAAAGARVALGWVWGIQGEVRLRSIDPFQGSVVEYGIGINKRI